MSEESISSTLDGSKESTMNVISPDKNVPRRKSSIFNRRSTIVDDNEIMQCCGSSSVMLERPTSDSDFNVDMYIALLKKEVADWDKMYKERKQARKLARKRYRLNTVLTDEDVSANLTEEDKKFLEGRPNYNRIGREAVLAMAKLSISLQKASAVEKCSQLLINYKQKTETQMRKKIVDSSLFD